MSAVPVYRDGVGEYVSHEEWLRIIDEEAKLAVESAGAAKLRHERRAQNMQLRDAQKAEIDKMLLEEKLRAGAQDVEDRERYRQKYGDVAQTRRLVKLPPLGVDAPTKVASVRPFSEQYADLLAARKRVTFDDKVRVIGGGSASLKLAQAAMAAVVVASAMFQS